MSRKGTEAGGQPGDLRGAVDAQMCLRGGGVTFDCGRDFLVFSLPSPPHWCSKILHSERAADAEPGELQKRNAETQEEIHLAK